MRVLMTGAGGMLGQVLADVLRRVGDQVRTLRHDEADVCDMAALRAAAGPGALDAVLHLAAYTRVDDCERESDRAYLVNGLGARNAALLAAERGAAVLYVSTDYVFSGEARTPYREYDAAAPLSVYGRSKLAGEQAVREVNLKHYVVRSSWLYGPGGTHFIATILSKAGSGEPVAVVEDQRGSPTYTADLAPALSRIARSGLYGTYHVTNAGDCTWYELAAEALRMAGVNARLESTTSGVLGRPAPRPAYSVLSNLLYDTCIGPPLPHWRDALGRYLKSERAVAR